MAARDWSQPCYTAETRQSGEYGSFCQRGNIATLIADEFSLYVLSRPRAVIGL